MKGGGTKRVIEVQDAREGRESTQSMDAKSTLTTLQVDAASPSIVGASPLLADVEARASSAPGEAKTCSW